jgi:DNA-directed RNA polymerase beta' subunit
MGDEMNCHLAQSIQARNELERIANVKYQIIAAKDSNPIIGCVQDSLSGAYMMSTDNNIPYSVAANLLCNTSSNSKNELKKGETFNGKQVFSHIIPEGINSVKKKGKDIIFQIKNGELLEGVLDKSQLSTSKNSIIHYVWDKYGPTPTQKFIDDTQRLILNYLLNRGLTVGLKDCIIPNDLVKQLREMIHTKIVSSNHTLTQYENDYDKITPEIGEGLISMDLNSISSNIGKLIMDVLEKDNGLNIMISSKSKGSVVNMTQIAGCLGQVLVESQRIKKRITGRTLPIFHQNDDTPSARGFVKSSFLDGLKGHEFFFHTMGGREGLIDTAIKSVTADTPIIIMENGEIKRINIGDWINNYLDDDNNKEKVSHYDDRNLELLKLEKLNVKSYIPTADADGNVSWGEITAITRHDPGDTLYEIITMSGRKVIVTESKSLLVWNKDIRKFVHMDTPNVKIGDYVPVTQKLENINDMWYGEFHDLTFTDENDRDFMIMNYNMLGKFCEIKDNELIISNNYEIINDVILDAIVKINIINKEVVMEKYPKVYDLTVPSTLNFGLANGLHVVDTAETGYIQRKCVKFLEDLNVNYEGIIRTANGVLVQYLYGDSGIDQQKQTQVKINLINMNNENIKEAFIFNDDETKQLEKKFKSDIKKFNDTLYEKMIIMRDKLRKIYFASTGNYKVIEDAFMLPINLLRISQEIETEEAMDMDPHYIVEQIEDLLTNYDDRFITMMKKDSKLLKDDDQAYKFMLRTALYEYIAPRKCLIDYKISRKQFDNLIEEIRVLLSRSLVEPGEMVGVVAAQSIGEPTSQLTLNTKHSAGKAGVSGVARIKEIMSYSKNIKSPQMQIYFDDKYSNSKSDTNLIASYLKHLTIRELISSAEILYSMDINNDELSKMIESDKVSNPFFVNNDAKDNIKSLPFIIRLTMNLEKMMDKETTLLDIKTKFVTYWYKNFSNLKNVKKSHKDILVNVDKLAILSNNDNIIHIRFRLNEFNYNLLTQFMNIILDVITLKGIDNIENVTQHHERRITFNDKGEINVDKEHMAITDGINLNGIKLLKGINHARSKINDINTIYMNYGIEAARAMIIYELITTFESNGAGVNHAHISLLVDMMTYSGEVISIDRHGMNKVDNDPISKASFEKTMDHFINAAIFSETDKMQSVSSRVALGRVIPGGTGAFDLLLDTEKLKNSEYIENETGGRTNFIPLTIEPLFGDVIKNGFARNDFFIPN